jgi:DNA gyrase subunit B
LEEHLLATGLDGAVLTLADGTQRAGSDLETLLKEVRQAAPPLANLARKLGHSGLVEQLALAGAFALALPATSAGALPSTISPPQGAENLLALLTDVATLMARLEPVGLRGEWKATLLQNGGYSFTRALRGVQEHYICAPEFLASADVRRLANIAQNLAPLFAQGAASLAWKEHTQAITAPSGLLTAISERGRVGISTQRYKGLGEMNPDQLWETTLDPELRSLLRVEVKHADAAEELFSTLMGDIVEPRRDFIFSNALNVTNLDA